MISHCFLSGISFCLHQHLTSPALRGQLLKFGGRKITKLRSAEVYQGSMTSLSSGMQSVPTLKVGLRISMGYVEVNDPDLLLKCCF